MNKIIKILNNIFFTIILTILLTYLLLSFTKKIGIYKEITGSMEDTLHVGDYILVKKEKEYKKGDIITYKENNYYVTHRIVDIKDNQIITKGDANNIEDDPIDKKSIIGKYIYKSNILNIIIKYKYIIVVILLILALIKGYVLKEKKQENI